jgi:hypothetical protein
MSLLISKVPRALEAKSKLFGFELGDLLIIFLYLATSNLIFGPTRLKFLMVWIGTAVLASVPYYVKRNRPDQYLQHWSEFMRTPSILTAGKSDTHYQPYLEKSLEAFDEKTYF